MDDSKKGAVAEAAVVVPPVVEADAITAKDAEISRLTVELGNYKTVALKRLGKLPGDAELIGVDPKSGLTVEEQVRKTLLENEVSRIEQEKGSEVRRLSKENAELKLALKNRPGGSTVGGDSGSSSSVKDNVFSEAQIAILTEKAVRLKADPVKFIEQAKKNFLRRQ